MGHIKAQPGSKSRGISSWGYDKVYAKSTELEESVRYEIIEAGDTVGCGVTKDGNIYFTRNGKRLGKTRIPSYAWWIMKGG